MTEQNGLAPRPSTGFRLAETRVVWKIVRALLVAPAVLVSLLIAYESDILSELPAYPATVAAFLIIIVLPGAVLQAVFLKGSASGPLERLAIALPLGLGVAVIPGLLVLERHTDLQEFATFHIVFASLVCGVSMLFWPRKQQDVPVVESGGPGRFLLFAVLLVVVAGIVTTPLWAKGRIAADFDDWTYFAYANDYIESDEINAVEPFLGTEDSVNPRMRSNVWVLMQAQVADVAGLPVSDAVLEYLRPLLTVFAVLATFALTRTLFKNTTVALIAAGFQLGYAFIDLSAQEGMGRNLLIRISEDKMVGAFLIFPVALIFLMRYIDNRSLYAFAGFAIVVLGLAFVHPVPLIFLATTIGALALIRLLSDRSFGVLREFGLLLVPVGLASIWPFIQRQLLVDVVPELFGTNASAITFRDQFHTVEVGAGLLIGNYHMILHPLMIVGIVLVPLVWLATRKSTGGQLVLALTAGSLVVFFTPLLATPVAEIMTPQTLWKMPWMIPVGPVLAMATYEGLKRLPSGLQMLPIRAVAPSIVLVAALGIGLVVVEQYEVLDGGAFYNWRSEESVVPWGGESIFLGGLDRTFAETWRLPDVEEAMLRWIERDALEGSVVLVELARIHHMIPGTLQNIYPVDFGGVAGGGERRDGATAFAEGALTVAELYAYLDQFDVDYIVAREVGVANEVLRESERAHFRQEFSPYLVYEVR